MKTCRVVPRGYRTQPSPEYTGHLRGSSLRLGFSYFVSPLLAFLPAFLLISLHAQSAATSFQPPAPSFKTNAQAVSLDVVVTSSNGQPILALGKQEFEVLEDGKPQAIDLFEEHTATSAPAATTPQLPPHVYTNQPAAPQGDSVNVLLLDNLNTKAQDQITLHKQIVDFLGKMPPGTQLAIFTLGSKLQLAQGFTADVSMLRAALDSKQIKTPMGSIVGAPTRQDEAGEDMQGSLMATSGARDAGGPAIVELKGNQAGLITLQALEQLARYLAGIPGRKNLIWFASSFPVSIFPNVKAMQSFNYGPEFAGTVRETAGLLTASDVAVYPVDAQGIHVDRSIDADSGGSSQGDNFSQDAAQDLANRTANTAAMEQLASDTGGKAFYTSNNLSESITSIIQNGAHFYTLVYTRPDRHLDGKFHRIQVLLKPDGPAQGKPTLSYRRGYYADDANAPQPKIPADPLPPLLARGLPASTQVLYQARVLSLAPQPTAGAPRAGGNGKLSGSLTRYKVDLDIDAKDLALDAAPDGTHTGKIEVALVAYDEAGNTINWTGQTLGLTLSPTSYTQVQRVGIPVHLQIDLPPKDISLATGVYDLTDHNAGTLEIALHPSSAATTAPVEPAPLAR